MKTYSKIMIFKRQTNMSLQVDMIALLGALGKAGLSKYE